MWTSPRNINKYFYQNTKYFPALPPLLAEPGGVPDGAGEDPDAGVRPGLHLGLRAHHPARGGGRGLGARLGAHGGQGGAGFRYLLRLV